MKSAEQLEIEIEETVGKLYMKLYELRQLKEYKREYDIMGTIIDMLSEDRVFMRENYIEYIKL
jgi:hypothetical protein